MMRQKVLLSRAVQMVLTDGTELDAEVIVPSTAPLGARWQPMSKIAIAHNF